MTHKPPLIGCTTYHKVADQNPPIEIYGLMPSYVRAIQAAGGIPILIPLGLNQAELHAIFDRIDGLLLPGGGDIDPVNYRGDSQNPTLRDIDEQRDWIEIELVRQAVAQEKPVLAICRGLQIFNVALGGTLWEDVQSQMPQAIIHDYFHRDTRDYLAHPIEIRAGSRLHQTLQTNSVRVNSLHHQGIRDLAPPLVASGVAPDQLVEAVEVPGHKFAIGVQWHPENLLEVAPVMRSLFTGLVAVASNGHH